MIQSKTLFTLALAGVALFNFSIAGAESVPSAEKIKVISEGNPQNTAAVVEKKNQIQKFQNTTTYVIAGAFAFKVGGLEGIYVSKNGNTVNVNFWNKAISPAHAKPNDLQNIRIDLANKTGHYLEIKKEGSGYARGEEHDFSEAQTPGAYLDAIDKALAALNKALEKSTSATQKAQIQSVIDSLKSLNPTGIKVDVPVSTGFGAYTMSVEERGSLIQIKQTGVMSSAGVFTLNPVTKVISYVGVGNTTGPSYSAQANPAEYRNYLNSMVAFIRSAMSKTTDPVKLAGLQTLLSRVIAAF